MFTVASLCPQGDPHGPVQICSPGDPHGSSPPPTWRPLTPGHVQTWSRGGTPPDLFTCSSYIYWQSDSWLSTERPPCYCYVSSPCEQYLLHYALTIHFYLTFTMFSSYSGTAIGTLITETGGKCNGLDIANGVLQAISSGTFIYVTFFEILQREISHDNSGIDKLLSVLLGFGVVAGLAAIPEPLMTTRTICEPYISTPPPT